MLDRQTPWHCRGNDYKTTEAHANIQGPTGEYINKVIVSFRLIPPCYRKVVATVDWRGRPLPRTLKDGSELAKLMLPDPDFELGTDSSTDDGWGCLALSQFDEFLNGRTLNTNISLAPNHPPRPTRRTKDHLPCVSTLPKNISVYSLQKNNRHRQRHGELTYIYIYIYICIDWITNNNHITTHLHIVAFRKADFQVFKFWKVDFPSFQVLKSCFPSFEVLESGFPSSQVFKFQYYMF